MTTEEENIPEEKMIVVDQHSVPEDVQHIRLIDYLVGKFVSLPSRTSLKKAIKRGEVLIDGSKAEQAMFVRPGQKIELTESEFSPPKNFELPLEIIFEDEYIALVNKPPGIPVSGNRYRTVQNALLYNIKPSIERDALKLPRPVHRLDTPTSGLLIVAKTATALMKLGHQLQNREITKQYRAIVSGKTPESGQIETPINGQLAISSYKTMRHIRSVKTNWLSLVDLFPVTGRTHQLRIHMANEGYPIVGDKLYVKDQPLLKGKGLFLCAIELEFNHPVLDTKLIFKIDQPAKFTALLDRESERWKKYH